MPLKFWLSAGVAVLAVANAQAAENVLSDEKADIKISIYNQDMALVKDNRPVNLTAGVNDIAFEGVATRIRPETALLFADGVRVLEQNYDYDLMNADNIVAKSVGQKVKTVTVNPADGKNIFDTATIVSANFGNPVLQFDYGIEANFPGRLVFEKMPAGLRSKPTLIAKVNSDAAASKDLSLAYLTNGIGWKTDYVAKVNGADKLDLTAWVTINNQSGADYKNAQIQLIAGEVNKVSEAAPVAMRLMAKNAVMSDGIAEAAVAAEDVSGYYLYTLPARTDIKDNQTKQISLIEKTGVSFNKEAFLTSPLYFHPDSTAEFKQQHPQMIYVLNNVEADNLGIRLPAGIMRFYENDSNGNLQFIGEDSISHTAKGEELRLNLGEFFNIYANGKIASVKKLSEEKTPTANINCQMLNTFYEYQVEVSFHNGGNNAETAVFKQNLPQDAAITAANIAGTAENARVQKWQFTVPANGQTELTYTVKAADKKRVCN